MQIKPIPVHLFNQPELPVTIPFLDLLFTLEGQPLKRFGSQGQQKTYLIALKLAQFELTAHRGGQKPVLLLDDILDEGVTLAAIAEYCRQQGAVKVLAYCTHPVLSGKAVERIENSVLDEVVVTNTIPLSAAAMQCQKIRQLTVAPLIAETIQRIARGESVMSLFSDQNNLF